MDTNSFSVVSMADQTDADDNSPGMTREGLFRRAVTFGQTEGKGGNSRPMLAFAVVEAAKAGVIKIESAKKKGANGTTIDDAKMIWERFARACAAAQNVGYVKMESAKQQESKIRSFIKLGLLPNVDGNRVMARTRDIMQKARDANGGKPLSKSPFDGYLAVARAQVTLSPDTEFDDAQIEAALAPAPKDDPEVADQLDALAKAADKIVESGEADDDAKAALEEVIVTMMAQIKRLGGTTADKRKAQQAAEKEAKAEADKARKVQALQARVAALVERRVA